MIVRLWTLLHKNRKKENDCFKNEVAESVSREEGRITRSIRWGSMQQKGMNWTGWPRLWGRRFPDACSLFARNFLLDTTQTPRQRLKWYSMTTGHLLLQPPGTLVGTALSSLDILKKTLLAKRVYLCPPPPLFSLPSSQTYRKTNCRALVIMPTQLGSFLHPYHFWLGLSWCPTEVHVSLASLSRNVR